MEEGRGYTRPDLLAEPDWVWGHRSDPTVRVIDCDTAAAYARAHIPGAVSLSDNAIPNVFQTLPNAQDEFDNRAANEPGKPNSWRPHRKERAA